MKIAVVTGGTSGMGLGVAKMLISKGYYVFTTYVGLDFTEEIDNFELSCPQVSMDKYADVERWDNENRQLILEEIKRRDENFYDKWCNN